MHTRDFVKYNTLGIIYMMMILFLCLTPSKTFIKDLGFFEIDKLVHILLFGSLTLLNRWGLERYFEKYPTTAKPLVLSGGISVLYGLLIEVLQEVMPTGRFFEWYDILANIVGVVFALILGRFVHNYR